MLQIGTGGGFRKTTKFYAMRRVDEQTENREHETQQTHTLNLGVDFPMRVKDARERLVRLKKRIDDASVDRFLFVAVVNSIQVRSPYARMFQIPTKVFRNQRARNNFVRFKQQKNFDENKVVERHRNKFYLWLL